MYVPPGMKSENLALFQMSLSEKVLLSKTSDLMSLLLYSVVVVEANPSRSSSPPWFLSISTARKKIFRALKYPDLYHHMISLH